ncbi:MFS transporter [Spelaeicoccus albus]|uniref:Putative proline/betaine transporter n=1 Tax=Spelaeicoccus albus TaxID=1280376 RepID=A0A7Z0ACE8_9MICO|nr:MFS transporter [Spelaeicoccus albus]NYI66636.1 MHS family proline/betaine transporter-like MFS transporter [Spelaeicoccus albus]
MTAESTTADRKKKPKKSKLPELTRVQDFTPEQRKTVRMSIVGSALGNAIEWFDYGVYGYLTVYISTVFFGGGTNALIFTFATFAVSFLVRPLGGIVLGPLGDRIGRQKVMVITIILMTVCTAAIGVLPTYNSVGILAPILLIVLRMIQGFSTGGEYGGAAVFMAEHAPDNRRGFFGSFLEFGTFSGATAAAILCTALELNFGDDGMLAGWWRLPFLCTLPLGLVALWIRTKLEDPDVFTEAAESNETESSAFSAFKDMVRSYWRQLLILMGFVALLNVAYYLVLTYMPTFLGKTLHYGLFEATGTLVIVQLIIMGLIPFMGRLSDKIGRKPLLITAAAGYIILPVPAVMLMRQGSFGSMFIGLGILGLLLVVLVGSVSSTLPALFPTHVRYTGFAIGYNVSTALFAGTASTIVESLVEKTGNTLMPGFYLMVFGVIGLAAILCMRETAGRSLRGTDPPGEDDEERVAQGQIPIGYTNID